MKNSNTQTNPNNQTNHTAQTDFDVQTNEEKIKSKAREVAEQELENQTEQADAPDTSFEADNQTDKHPVHKSKVDKNADLVAELTNDLQRTRADFENYRKQIEAQKSQVASIAKGSVIDRILPLIDNFERAIQTYPDELSALKKSFDKTLKELGLTRINSEVGAEFNPDLHDAVMFEEGDGDAEIIVETLRPGYMYEGAVIRPAMVKVSR